MPILDDPTECKGRESVISADKFQYWWSSPESVPIKEINCNFFQIQALFRWWKLSFGRFYAWLHECSQHALLHVWLNGTCTQTLCQFSLSLKCLHSLFRWNSSGVPGLLSFVQPLGNLSLFKAHYIDSNQLFPIWQFCQLENSRRHKANFQ